MATANKSLVTGLALVASLGGLLFGYDTAVISGAVGAIDHNFINGLVLPAVWHWPILGWPVDAETLRSSISGWTISCALLGCVIGAAIGGPLSNAFGRKGGLLIAGLLFLLGSVGSAVPEFGLGQIGAMGSAALTPFIIYRIIGGVGVGLASMLAPLYIAEIAPPSERGWLVTFQQIAIVTGILVVYFVNWGIAASHPGNDAWNMATGWRWMLASEAIPSLIFLALLFTVPDSPRWFVMKGKKDKALAVLKKLTDDATAQATLRDIEGTLVETTRPLMSFGAKVLLVGIFLSIFQQFIGINAVLYYAPLMFKNMGASTDSSLLQTIVIGIAMLVFTLVALVTVDRWGRKPLLVTGAVIMAVSMFAIGFLFNGVPHSAGGALMMTPQTGHYALFAVVAYIAGFSLSWGPVTWVLLAEIFPNSIKGKAMAIAVAAQWIANLFVSITFKILDSNSALNASFNHGFAYWIYGVMSVLAALFVIRYVPETKQRSLEAIEGLWSKR